MPDVPETLQQLVQRRQRELGGSTGPLSNREVWLRGGGAEEWSYEIVRKVAELGHHRIGDKVAERLSVALDVPVNRILTAAGQRTRGRPFQLPARSARLTGREREILVEVMDAMLGAYSDLEPTHPTARTAITESRTTPEQRRRRRRATDVPTVDVEQLEGLRLAEPGSLDEEPAHENGDSQ